MTNHNARRTLETAICAAVDVSNWLQVRVATPKVKPYQSKIQGPNFQSASPNPALSLLLTRYSKPAAKDARARDPHMTASVGTTESATASPHRTAAETMTRPTTRRATLGVPMLAPNDVTATTLGRIPAFPS